MAVEPVKSTVGKLAIGLAVNCDRPAKDVERLIRENMQGASMLPFVAALTPDGRWIDGYSGFKEREFVRKFVETAAKSPLLNASDADRTKMRAQIAIAEAAANKGRWGDVAVAVHAASSLIGRCPERKDIDKWRDLERKWKATRYDRVVADAVAGKPLADAKKLLRAVQQAYKGHDEAGIAKLGVTALADLRKVRKLEAQRRAKKTLRDDKKAKFKGSPWTRLFDKPAPKKKQ